MNSMNTRTGLNPVSMLLSRGLLAFDLDGGAPAPAGSGAPAAPAAPAPAASVSDASKAYLAGLTAEQKAAPLAMPAEASDNIDDDGGDEFEADGVATPKTAAIPAVAPAAEAAPAEHVIARADGATWNESSRRWQQADGTFVDGEAPSADELTALETARTAAKAEADQQAAAAAKKTVTLTGLEEKGEQPLEIELDDEIAAERIRRLQNDGLRRKAYQEMKGRVDEERAELTAVTAAIEADPVSFVVGSMTPERQLEVARALLAEHFDKLIPDIQAYDHETEGPIKRADARVQLRDRVAGSREAITETQVRQRHAAACMNAAQAAIPETADAATVADFMRDVEIDLVHAARAGKPVTPETVPQLIDRRLKLYGFGAGSAAAAPPAAPAPAAAPRAESAPTSVTARPVGEKTQAIAARVVTKEAAKAAQNRIRQVQTTRQTAAAVAPPGAGAAPVQVPVIPATADIKTASKIIRQQGNAGWAG